MSRDPIVKPGREPYTYVGDDPSVGGEPSGLWRRGPNDPGNPYCAKTSLSIPPTCVPQPCTDSCGCVFGIAAGRQYRSRGKGVFCIPNRRPIQHGDDPTIPWWAPNCDFACQNIINNPPPWNLHWDLRWSSGCSAAKMDSSDECDNDLAAENLTTSGVLRRRALQIRASVCLLGKDSLSGTQGMTGIDLSRSHVSNVPFPRANEAGLIVERAAKCAGHARSHSVTAVVRQGGNESGVTHATTVAASDAVIGK